MCFQIGEAIPRWGQWRPAGREREVDQDLPALEHLGRTAVATTRPGAVSYANQVGAGMEEK